MPPPDSIPANENISIDVMWHIFCNRRIQEEIQDMRMQQYPFLLDTISKQVSFDFEVELVESLAIVFLGDDGYSLLSSENTDDFVHEQWDMSTASDFFAHFYAERFWRLDVR